MLITLNVLLYLIISSILAFENVQCDTNYKNYPIIVRWTSKQNPGLSRLQCPESKFPVNCLVTSDRKYFEDNRTRGFLFYGTDVDEFDLPLPRKPAHQWALFHEESPMNKYLLVHRPMIELFNYTSTFRRYSDLPLSTFCLEYLEYLTEMKPVPTALKNQYQQTENLAPVVYVQSHCDVASDRDRYVKELMKYIQVDSYGACLHNKDLPEDLRDPVMSMESPDFIALLSKYKFVLAMENAICDDYITEKLFRTFHVGSIPIYKGAPNVKDWLPSPNSAVIIDDFSSPEELAEYIKTLNGDDTAYNSFLSYKTEGIQNSFLLYHMEHFQGDAVKLLQDFDCFVCANVYLNYQYELQGQPIQPKVANLKHLQCPQPEVTIGNLEDLELSDSWLNMFWLDDYWDGLDKGLAIEKMIADNETNSYVFRQYWNQIAMANPRPFHKGLH